MPTGTVKWFNNAKGYGFILPEDGGEDLFVHYSSIRMDGYKTLKAGQSVRFGTHATDKGFHAIDVECADEAPEGTSTTDADDERADEEDSGTFAEAPPDHALG